MKYYKKWKSIGNSLSVLFATGGLASSVATGGIALVAISTVSLLIQGWMKHKDLDLKIHHCTYAYQSYQHLLNTLKDMMRSGEYEVNSILHTMRNLDDFVVDNSPIIDKHLSKYDEKFTSL